MRLSFFLIAGLDPAIQKAATDHAPMLLDARVKPGHEEEHLFCERAEAMP
jgi:hypothetical protein